MAKELIVDLSTIDQNRIVADIEAIRAINPQRFEMEQLTAILYEDLEQQIIVGYKDIGRDEFWVQGHMPNMPLMPGVMMLEAAAQMCSYYSQKNNVFGASMIGFGGLEDVRFRGIVVPGDRLMLLAQLTKIRRNRMIICDFQGVVKDTLVVEGTLKGIPIPVEQIPALDR